MDSRDGIFSDDELDELALSTPYLAEFDASMVPWSPNANVYRSALPEWYMAPAMGVRHGRARKFVVGAVIGGFLVINGLGLCITWGYLTLA